MLGIGLGCLYMVAAFGGTIREGKNEKNILVSVNQINPLTNEMKKKFKAVRENNFFIDSLPECYDVVATAGREIAIINDIENPCFGIQFNPEIDAETIAIIRNFRNFAEVWEKYHK